MLLLIFLFSGPELVGTKRLELAEFIRFSDSAKPRVCSDGSILIAAETTVFHFDRNGSFIRKVGRKGQAPGEFQYIQSVEFIPGADLSTYIIIDGAALRITKAIYSGNAEPEFSITGMEQYFEALQAVGNHSERWWIGQGGFPVTTNENQKWLVGFSNFSILERNSVAGFSEYRFHPLTDTIHQLRNNYYNHFIALVEVEGNEILVVANELDPLVWKYTLSPMEVAKFNQGKIYEAISQGRDRLDLRSFKEAPSEFLEPPWTPVRIRAWQNRWSRIHSLFNYGGKLIVQYSQPSPPEDPPRMYITKLDLKGRSQAGGYSYPIERYVLGTFDTKILTLTESFDRNEFDLPRYILKEYEW